MSKQEKPKVMPINLKEQKAVHTFRVVIRDVPHFYRLVAWLNDNVGKGADKWTMEGRILKRLKNGPVNPAVYIFRPDFDEASALYLSLI